MILKIIITILMSSICYHGISCSKKTEKEPFVFKFITNKKQLWYVAAVHAYPLTYTLIDKSIKRLKPQAIIVEGIEPGKILETISKYELFCDSINGSCPEPIYAAILARNFNIPIFTGEPEDRKILEYLQKNNYTLDDFLGFYLLRQIAIWNDNNKNSLLDIKNKAAKFLAETKNNINIKYDFSWNEFELWYNQHALNTYNFNEIFTENICQQGNYFYYIGQLIDQIREKNILKTIEKSLALKNKVLVVYGKSHFFKEKEKIKEILDL